MKTNRLAVFVLIMFSITANSVIAEPVERKYAPDRKVDILHITIDVTPNFKERTVSGTTTISFAPIAKPLTELQLNAVDLTVTSVTSESKIEGYTVTDDFVIITFDPPVAPDVKTSVTLTHEAEPKLGLYFRTPDMGYREEDTHLWTQGEPHEAPHWFPNYDYPNERSSSEVICHVPQDMTVVSNGRLITETIDRTTGLKTVCWLQEKPHVNYLIALAAGKFKKIESTYKNIPLAFYTPASQIEQASNSFKDTADMVGFLEREIGIPYPWNKYYQVVVDDFSWGGMENTTMTILSDNTLFTEETENIRSSQQLVVHELTHMWFGDYVTCKDWSHLWLNEGFAVYYAHLYDRYKNGPDSMLYGLYKDSQRVLAEREVHNPIVYKEYEDADQQFDYRAYPKGSWVLHMLRTELGDELFSKCVKTYVERNALSSVVTEDFNSVIEELTGRSYDRFFDQWVYHARHPDLNVKYSWSEKEKLAKVTVEQTQTVDDNVMLYHFDTKVRFVVNDAIVDRNISVDKAKHDFYFPLVDEPEIVRFDPDYGLLCTITFDKPAETLYAQLVNTDDVIGRIRAVEALKEKKDRKTVEKLQEALNSDSFYGVRIEASSALRNIHTNEAFDALSACIDQPDARVRLQVVRDIGGFYRPESLKLTTQILEKEQNPDILYEAIRNLGRYHHRVTKKMITGFLQSQSYRNRLTDAAISAIRQLDDPVYIKPLQKILESREKDFTSFGFVQGLDALAYITRNEDDKSGVREFLTDRVNHKKMRVQIGVIDALGTLGDPRTIPVLETFAGNDSDDRIQKAAQNALKNVREEKDIVPEEIMSLREVVDELKKENDEVKKDLEDIKKRLEATEEGKEGN
ncbi:MAG: HEAT repeat domain-containing protein [Candidatus Latescibacteria bacterium]|nr:HEAT repeat domain-containing protein [Candidatus Latescibacterota bacterium]